MHSETGRILTHTELGGDYRLLTVEAEQIAAGVRPGQFVHVRVPRLGESVLRRPFSIYRAAAGKLSVLYKCVGKGTRALALARAGEELDLMGPLGNGFPDVGPATFPVLVAGGYGVAPLYLVAAGAASRGIVFIGAKTAPELLCRADFEALDWPIEVATEDGSVGHAGMVTAALDEWTVQAAGLARAVFFACGPDAMLRAVGERAVALGRPAWLSLDRHMGCGVGACLACVQKVRRPDGSCEWARVCRDGPVFEAREIVWE